MSVSFDNEGFAAPGSRISISKQHCIPSFLYEAGAILGRARHDKIDVLRKMMPTTTSGREEGIEEVLYRAKTRLEKYQRDFGTEPQTFRGFIPIGGLSQIINKEVSPREIEPYILPLMLEGIVFGSLFPEITRKMNRKFYDSVEIDWDTWFPRGAEAALVLPKIISAFPGEPSILSLEGQEETLLRVVGDYTANFYPELVDPLDLSDYREDEAFVGLRHYKGWWQVYDSIIFSDSGAL